MKTKITKNFDLFFFITTVVLILIFAVFGKAQSSQFSALEIMASDGAVHAGKSGRSGRRFAKARRDVRRTRND
jgi:hypothetical protein